MMITGSANGLGRDMALYFAKAGYTLVVHYNKSKKEAETVLQEIKKYSAGSIMVQGDLKNKEEVRKVFAKVFKKYPKIDVLVNNVGNFLYKKLSDTTDSEFRDALESNIYVTLFCTREVLPIMRKSKSGHIINIGAAGADRFIFRDMVIPYFIAKNAVFVLTKAMAFEEAKNGIHINMISPASMKTDIFKKSDFPMGREVKYSDVISVVEFLLSERAYYINGANIEVTGGFTPGIVRSK